MLVRRVNIGHIAGGTNAGWRRPKQTPSAWICSECGKKLQRFWTACPNDNTRRPDSSEEN